METIAKDERQPEGLMQVLRRQRIANGFTQTSLAAALKLKSPSAVSLWEAGKRVPPPPVIPPLAKLLGLNAFELTDMIENERRSREASPVSA